MVEGKTGDSYYKRIGAKPIDDPTPLPLVQWNHKESMIKRKERMNSHFEVLHSSRVILYPSKWHYPFNQAMV
jgi:hypothetical protein